MNSMETEWSKMELTEQQWLTFSREEQDGNGEKRPENTFRGKFCQFILQTLQQKGKVQIGNIFLLVEKFRVA